MQSTSSSESSSSEPSKAPDPSQAVLARMKRAGFPTDSLYEAALLDFSGRVSRLPLDSLGMLFAKSYLVDLFTKLKNTHKRKEILCDYRRVTARVPSGAWEFFIRLFSFFSSFF